MAVLHLYIQVRVLVSHIVVVEQPNFSLAFSMNWSMGQGTCTIWLFLAPVWDSCGFRLVAPTHAETYAFLLTQKTHELIGKKKAIASS